MQNQNEPSFRCCYGVMTRDHGAFNYLYRWSVRHMLTEFLMVAILVYLQLTDRYAGLWSMSAALISLLGASIPSFCFSNAPGWRANFGLQVIVIVMRIAVVSFIIWSFTAEFQDTELTSNRICQLATIILSTLSLSPLFHMSLKSTWLISMRPMEIRGAIHPLANGQAARVNTGRESLINNRDGGNASDNQSRSYPPHTIAVRKGDIESNHNSNMNSNMKMSDSYFHQERDKYVRELEINYIEEGNEDEPDDDVRSDAAMSVLSAATTAQLNRKSSKPSDMVYKDNVSFSYENAMHSNKRKPNGAPLALNDLGANSRSGSGKHFYNSKNCSSKAEEEEDEENMSINSRNSVKQKAPTPTWQSSTRKISATEMESQSQNHQISSFSPPNSGQYRGGVQGPGFGFAPRSKGEKGLPLGSDPDMDDFSAPRFSPKGVRPKGNVNLLSI